MYTLFIVDDEREIREGLKFILDWESLGFEICGEAGNGEDALNSILELSPDLVLLDIRMPRMLGIDVAKEAREEGFRGHFVILSGYSDFSYAQKAITYNVDNYLTKPIDEAELLDTILLVKERLETEKAKENSMENYKKAAKHVLLSDVIKGDLNPNTINTKELNLDSDIYQVVLYQNFTQEISATTYSFADLLKVSNKDNTTFDYVNDGNEDIILLKGTRALKRFQRFLNHYEDAPQKGSPLDSIFLAYGQTVTNLKDIPLSYKQASKLMRRRFFCIQGQHTLGYKELPTLAARDSLLTEDMLQEYVGFFVGYIQSYNRKKMAEYLYNLEQYLYNVKNEIEDVKLFLTDLYLRTKEKTNHLYNNIEIPFPSNASVIDVIKSKHYLYEIVQFLSEQFEMVMNATGNPSRNSIMDDILYYIDRNFHGNIKLESIAPLFGYNSAYLGKIFNKTFGESFNSYLDRKRIERSKELLLENKLKVYEIAEQVGYNNIDYFHKKFKRSVGVSPAEFRKASTVTE